VYKAGQTTEHLLEGGVLYGPSNPPEALIPGGVGTAWKLVQTKPCAPAVATVAVSWPTVTPATCTAPGGLSPDFTQWPAAQNPNGWEGDGYHLYVSPALDGPGTYTLTAYHIGGAGNVDYPHGTLLTDGDTTTPSKTLTHTLTIPAQLSGADCIVADASAALGLDGATCTEAGVPTYSIENATWVGPATLSDGVWTRTARADDGHSFADGSDTATVTVKGADALPQQSDDASQPCYVAPTVPTEPTTPTEPTKPTEPTTPTTPTTPSTPSAPTTTTHTSHTHTASVTPKTSKSLDSAKVKTAEPKALQTTPKASQKLAHTGQRVPVGFLIFGLLVFAAGAALRAFSRKVARR